MRRLLLCLFALVLLPAPAAAVAQKPVVYSSLPLQGPHSGLARDTLRGMRLALERAGDPVRLISLSDANRRYGWMPELVSRNARRAAQNAAALAYIGEFNSGATSIALPILNESGLLQVSPSNTAVGLTEAEAQSDSGEPDKYYPSGRRTYGRVIPNDVVQGQAGALMMRDAGVARALFVHDGEVYGRGMARLTMRAAGERGLEALGLRRLGRRNARTIAREARRRGAQGVYVGGSGDRPTLRLWRALGRVRGLKLFGPDGLALSPFLRRMGPGLQRRTQITLLPMDASAYPEAAQEVLRTLGPGTSGYAVYGYEAMSVVIDAIARGAAGGRQGVVDAFFATRDRDSILGRYSIDANGDTSLTHYGVWGVRGGRLAWDHMVDAAAP